MNWFRKRDHSYRVEMGSLPRKVAWESMNYEDYDTLAIYFTFIEKSLFVDNLHAFLYFTCTFWEMIP